MMHQQTHHLIHQMTGVELTLRTLTSHDPSAFRIYSIRLWSAELGFQHEFLIGDEYFKHQDVCIQNAIRNRDCSELVHILCESVSRCRIFFLYVFSQHCQWGWFSMPDIGLIEKVNYEGWRLRKYGVYVTEWMNQDEKNRVWLLNIVTSPEDTLVYLWGSSLSKTDWSMEQEAFLRSCREMKTPANVIFDFCYENWPEFEELVNERAKAIAAT